MNEIVTANESKSVTTHGIINKTMLNNTLTPYRGRIKSFDDLYMVVLWPRAVGQNSEYVLWWRGTTAYAQNSGLDINKDGKVTKNEAASQARNIGFSFVGPNPTPTPATIQHDPVGYLDYAEGLDGKLHISGWALDYDDPSKKLDIHVYIGGKWDSPKVVWGTDKVKANTIREDVPRTLNQDVGNDHGFDAIVDVNVTGTYPVYVYGINVGSGKNSELLENGKIVTISSAIQTCSLPNCSITDIAGGKQINISAKSDETIHYTIKKNGAVIGNGSTVGSYSTSLMEVGNYEVSAHASKTGCQDSGTNTKNVTVSKAATPSIEQVVTGTGVVVNIKSETNGAAIYYTTSGNEPSVTKNRYTGTLVVDEEKIIKAIAVKDGFVNSDVGEAEVKLTIPDAPTGFKLTTDEKLAVGSNVSVQWDGATAAARYTVELFKDSKKINSTTTSATYTTFELPEVGKYQIKIYASNFVGNSVVSSTVLNVEAMKPSVVKFVDWDGTELASQEVPYRGNATLPGDPYRRGYTFQSWVNGDKISDIKSDLTVTAKYKINVYQIRFFDASGKQVGATQKVEYGSAAVSPENELTDIPKGYVFSGWKVIESANDSLCDYQSVDSDMKLQAVYYWENDDLPVLNEITSATWNEETGTYKVNVELTNYPKNYTTAMLRVSLYTSKGQMVKTSKSEFVVNADGTGNKEVTLKYSGKATIAKACILGFKGDDQTGGGLSKEAEKTITRLQGSTWSDWSDWSTEKVESTDRREVETKTQYRYADKSTTTSTASSLNGWTQYGSYVNYGDYGGWSAWQRDAVGGSDTRQVESATVYGYYYFLCPNCGAHMHVYTRCYTWAGGCGASQMNINSGVVMFSTTPWSSAGLYEFKGTGRQATDSLGGGRWFKWEDANNTGTGYRYRDRSKTTIYQYNRWNEWSAWSDTPYTSGDNRKVESRTLYQYRNKEDVYEEMPDNPETGNPYTISGTLKFTDPDLSGKVATVMVYKGKNVDPNEDQIQYIGQTTMGSGNTYSFTVNTKEVPSVLSGDYTVCLGVEGMTSLINVDMIQAPKAEYTVVYQNDDGTEISSQKVHEGENAAAPDAPKKDGYLFAGWSDSATNVSSDMTITAQYEPVQYTVVFVDSKNNVNEEDAFYYGYYGDEIVTPEEPTAEGCTFLGWDKIMEGTTTITGNMVLHAVYETQTFTVTFVDEKGKSISAQNVSYGGCALPPASLDVAGREFVGWSTAKNWWNVTEDVTVEPILVYAETVNAPSYQIIDLEDSIAVILESTTPDATIYYSFGDTVPDSSSYKYEEPIVIADQEMWTDTVESAKEIKATLLAELNAVAISDGKNDSEVQKIVYNGERTYSLEQEYAVTFNSNGGEAVLPNTITILENEAIGSLPTSVREGYQFVGWFTDVDAGTQITEETIVTADMTVYAHWKKEEKESESETETEPVGHSETKVTVASVSGRAGTEVTVPVSITKNPGIAGYSLDVNYDADVLTLKSINKGSLLTTGQLSTNGNVFNWYTDDNITGDGMICSFVFAINKDAEAGSTKVSVSLHDGKKNLVNEDGNYVEADYVAGAVQVTRGIMGDINSDEDITIADVVVLNRYVLGKAQLTAEVKALADTNGDGDITIGDVVVLNRFVIGKIASLGKTDAKNSSNEVGSASAKMAAETGLTVAVGAGKVKPGEKISVPVELTGNPGIAGFAFTVVLPEGFTLDSMAAGEMLAGGTFTTDGQNCTWYTSDNITSEGKLFDLNLTAGENAESGEVRIELLQQKANNLSDENGATVPASFKAGTITVEREVHEHSFAESVTKEATCTEEGEKTYSCACGESYTEAIPAKGHGETELRDAKEATYEEEGYTGDTYCKVCGEKIETGNVIDKLPQETEKSEPETEKPNPETEKPNPETEKPNPETEKPNPETEKPNPETEKPNPETEKPNLETEKPNLETEKPNPETEKPNPETEKPQPTTEKPQPEKKPEVTKPAVGTVAEVGGSKYQVVMTGGKEGAALVAGGQQMTSVPKTVQIAGHSYAVTAIGDRAFFKNKNLKNVTIPDTVVTIGKSAFQGCINLKKVTIGRSVQQIGNSAFNGCKKLKKVKVNTNVLKTVGKKAFRATDKNLVIKVPKKNKKAYTKLFKNKGNKTAKVK